MFKQQFFILCALLTLVTSSYGANITVRTDRNPVVQDETFHITYEADTGVDDDPDFSAIYEKFDVLNSSLSTNMRMINGNYSMKKTWDLTLIGTKTGTFTIPSIPFGKDLSPALRIKVAKNSDDTGKIETGEIFVEVSADKKTSYVESEIIYTVRVLRTIEIAQGSFSKLETSDPDAIIINLGNVPQYKTKRKGKRYIVNEVRYAVYPQHSGEITFKKLLFQARISRNNSRSMFDQFLQAGEIKRIRTKKTVINIKPKPSNISTDQWLPVKNLTLNEDWSDDLSNIKVGEPITRTITLSAKGFTATQLPEINFQDLDNVKQYPDKAVTQDTNTASGISAVKQFKVAIIPTQAGLFTMPEIAIPWWNTKTKQLEIAKIPETTITAVGSVNNLPIFPTAPVISPTKSVVVNNSDNNSANYWPWISLTLAIGWLLTIFYNIYRSKTSNRKTKPIIKAIKSQSLKPFENTIKNACNSSNSSEAKNALINWARIFWQTKNINSLADIASRSNPAFGEALIQLNNACYSPKPEQWNGTELLKEFNHFRVIERYIEDTHTTQLEPLYK